ncbi:MAG TPA: hypothetical protein VIL30_12385 [Ramlibacter sp.]
MRLFALAFAAVLLGGCAHPWNTLDVAPGATREQVVARAGQPTRVVALPDGGQRLQYSGQPLGQYAFMVDLDAGGRVVRARQVLTAAEFARIQPGTWTRADIEREFGPPARVDGVSSWNGPVLTYRWREQGDMFYWVYLDPQGVVRRAHQGIEHVNAPNDRD